MKQIITIIGMLLMFAGCQENSEKTVEFETITTDRTTELSNEKNSPRCMVHIQLEEATKDNGHAGELINTTIMKKLLRREEASMLLAAEAFANEYIDTYKSSLLPLYNEDRADTTKRSWYQYHYIITSKTQRGSKGTVVYLANFDYYEGGAHSINQLYTMNFDTETGQLLTLSDIFASGYEKALQQTLMNALKTKTGCKTLKELRREGYLRGMSIYPTENFILNEETITFVYNPYEIAPYDMGATELIIPFSDVEKLFKNSFKY